MSKITAVPSVEPRDIGKCIYCGSEENLTDEHILPRGLGGPWKLHDASCKKCAGITSKIEREVERGQFSLLRTKIHLPTYHPQKRPTSFDFLIKDGDREDIISYPASECPTLFVMPMFKKPGCVLQGVQREGILYCGATLHGSGYKEFIKKHKNKKFSYSIQMGTSFARVLAKIAYGMVVLKYGLDRIQENYVIPCILGLKDDVGQWVGCERPHESPALLQKERLLHRIECLELGNKVGVRVRLFANYETPEYLVVVGRSKDN